MSKLSKCESLSIRYAQALGVVLVVIGHYQVKIFDMVHPNVFHMPLFFFIGGLLYRSISLKKLLNDLTYKYFAYIAYTYVIIGILTILMIDYIGANVNSPFSETVIGTFTNALTSNFHNNQYFLVAWFLFSYAIIRAIAFIVFKIKNAYLIFSIAIITGYVSVTYMSPAYWESKNQLFNVLSQVMFGFMFYSFGSLFKKFILKASSFYYILVSFAIIFTLNVFGNLAGLNMSWSKYPQGFIMHTLTASLGILSIFVICNTIAASGQSYRLLDRIGSDSKYIMTYHLLAFTCVDYFFYSIGLFDIAKSSALIHYISYEYWYLYIILGVLIPVGISITTNYILEKIKMTSGVSAVT